jgi:hypothetical protein
MMRSMLSSSCAGPERMRALAFLSTAMTTSGTALVVGAAGAGWAGACADAEKASRAERQQAAEPDSRKARRGESQQGRKGEKVRG